jgi:hypothetical protein
MAVAPAPAPPPAPPAITPSTATNPAIDRGAHPPAEDKRMQPPTTLGPELLGGGGFRLDGGPDGFAQHTAGDFNFGLGVWAALSRETAFGLVYQRIGLGSARTVPTGSSVSAAYDLNVIWAALRLYPMRGEHTRLFAGLQVGAGWQNIQADGVNVTGEVVTAKPFVCSESSGPTFSIGPTAGLDVDVDRHIAFVAELGAGAHAMSGDMIGGCAPGAGSALTLAGRVGLAYRFDADRWFGEQAGNRSTASLAR